MDVLILVAVAGIIFIIFFIILLLRNVESAGSKQYKLEQSVNSDEGLKSRILKTSELQSNIEAIKFLSREKGMSFKSAVKTIMILAKINSLGLLDNKVIDTNSKNEIINYLRSGNNILAIKILKDKLGLGLSESKHLADLIDNDLQEKDY